MTSINTNVAAITALQSLSRVNQDLLQTQSRISTGYRVGEASDGAAYWSMATTMRSDNAALSSVSDALGLGSATLDVTYTGMDTAIDVATEIKTKLVAAREPGVDRTKVQSEIDALQDQLRTVSASAAFSGENWLSVNTAAGGGYNATESIVASFSRSGTTVSVTTIDVTISSTFLFDSNGAATADARGILASNRDATTGAIAVAGTFSIASVAGGGNEINLTATTTDAQIDGYIQGIDVAISEMTTAASNLGAAKSRVDMQANFVSKLMDSISRGIGTLVDADMNEESTRLQALQVQQQLGIQAMSIANSSAQSILSLFR